MAGKKGSLWTNSACARNHNLLLKLNQEGKSLTAMSKIVGTHKRHVKAFLKRNGAWRHFPLGYKGDKSAQWKGGRTRDKSGYVLMKVENHPYMNRAGYVREHRLVMERQLGRYLFPHEVVHHINGDPADNRIENLQLFSDNRAHLKHELTGKVPNWTDEGREKIRQGVILSAIVRRERIAQKKASLDAEG